jgi:hypothetical protein
MKSKRGPLAACGNSQISKKIVPCAATYYKELDYRYFPFGLLSTVIVAADRPQVTEWIKCNPHTLNLARLRLVRADGTEIQAG